MGIQQPILLRPGGPDQSCGFYRGVWGLALHRGFGPAEDHRVVLFFSDRAGGIGQRDPGAFGCGDLIDPARGHQAHRVAVGCGRDGGVQQRRQLPARTREDCPRRSLARLWPGTGWRRTAQVVAGMTAGWVTGAASPACPGWWDLVQAGDAGGDSVTRVPRRLARRRCPGPPARAGPR
jgi:hypothetical protein